MFLNKYVFKSQALTFNLIITSMLSIKKHQARSMGKTRHIQARMSQRGICQELFDIALQYGEPVQDKVILGKKALQLLLNELQEIERQTLLKAMDKGGIVVVVSGEQLITTYNLNSYSRRKAIAQRG